MHLDCRRNKYKSYVDETTPYDCKQQYGKHQFLKYINPFKSDFTIEQKLDNWFRGANQFSGFCVVQTLGLVGLVGGGGGGIEV